ASGGRGHAPDVLTAATRTTGSGRPGGRAPPTGGSSPFAPCRRAPPFFACAKKPGAKKAHPACAPGAAHQVRGAGGIFRAGILPARKTPHIPVRRPAGLVRRLRRYGGAPEIKIKIKISGKGNGNGTNRRARC